VLPIVFRHRDGNIDGNFWNDSVTHTEFQFQPWWEADLGADYNVAFVDVYNRTDCCGERLSNFNVWITKDGSTSSTGLNTPGQAGSPTRVEINAPARFVRIQLVGTDFLSLGEVVIWTQ
jgi:hypothetical protein